MSKLDRLAARFAEREPGVQAFLPEEGRFERLRREEETLHARWPDPAKRPPLFGVPVGVKDIFRVDGFETRAGSRLPPETFAGPEASCVTALREAGALILGKTVSTEFAYFAPGPTRNPRNPEHTPGGSSSGSAAAVAAGLCPLALGTQTIGSIIRPAAFCGVVGFKPTYGRVPVDGVIPFASSLDTVGFFTQDAESARVVASLLCSRWRTDRPERRPRLGVPEGPYLERASPEAQDHFWSVCDRLTGAGYEIAIVPVMADFEQIVERHYRIAAAEMARVHAPWFDRFEDLYDPRTAELIRRGRGITDAQLEEDRKGRDRLLDVLTGRMDDYRFDLWISPPAVGPAPRGLDATGDPLMNLPWTHAMMPVVCLPAGRNAAGLPMGLQVAAGLGDDEELLCFAIDLERVVWS
ncbi:MAG TPA: amidase [Thermoanaerobaculia bacterium]|jgi:Asp-tRNA(Asn)/Glu-tRNA(Gln) amidotransferase A subunit family amidase|nr:amidase [Thermoanaerobaculia bacterium]